MKRERLTMRLAAASATTAEDKKKKKQNGEMSRNLDGFEFDSKNAKILKKALHNINVSLGTLLAAMKEMAMLKGSDVTPDGMLGGRGFIMSFKDMKTKINEAVNDLSDVTDTLADELTNPKWGLSKSERSKVKEEKKEIEEKTEEIEEVPAEEENKTEEPASEEVNPDDVKDSAELEAIKRYKSFIDGNVKDKVATVLSKNIMATITKEAF